jgi:hypothetical protein
MRLFLLVLLAATLGFSQVVISVDENVSRNHDKNLFSRVRSFGSSSGYG